MIINKIKNFKNNNLFEQYNNSLKNYKLENLKKLILKKN